MTNDNLKELLDELWAFMNDRSDMLYILGDAPELLKKLREVNLEMIKGYTLWHQIGSERWAAIKDVLQMTLSFWQRVRPEGDVTAVTDILDMTYLDLTQFCWKFDRVSPDRLRLVVYCAPGYGAALASALGHYGAKQKNDHAVWVRRTKPLIALLRKIADPSLQGLVEQYAQAMDLVKRGRPYGDVERAARVRAVDDLMGDRQVRTISDQVDPT